MIALKLEQVGDRLAVVLDEAACAALHAKAGDTLLLQNASEAEPQDVGFDSRHERGRAFLKRYQRNLGAVG